MKKNKLSNIFMLVLLLSSYISALVTISPSVSTAAKDITNLVDITGCEVTKNGHEINDENKIVKGDTIHIKYFWEVSKENMDGVEAGDSFTLSLPDPTYFGGYGDEGPYDLDNPYDGPSLGKYSLIGNNFVVEINEEGAKQDVLADGWLSVDVKALKAGTNIDGGGNGAVTIPKLEITDPGGGEGHDPDDEAFPDDQLPFHKKGKQNHGQNSINWSFVVNNQGLNELIETYSANQESGLNNKIIPRENGLLIDKLDPGMKFQDGSLFVTIPVQIINSEGHMGTRFVKGTNNLQIQDQFIRVYPQEGEEYEDFQNRVRNYPTENGSLAYGVYTDSENSDTVFVAFGNMPGDHALYNEVHAGAIANAIMNDDTLSQEQKEALQTIYCDPENSPGGGGIVAYGLSFNADVQVGEGYGNGIYANKAQFIWGEDGSEEDEWDTHFHQIGGSVTGEFIQVEKEVEGTGALVKPRHFEFEIVDQADPTNPIAYGITDKEVTQKGERVKVNFYKNKSSQAEYTNEIDGNGEVNGWRSVLTDGHSYLIREIGSPEYSPLITGGTGEGDQYDYNANIEKRTHFLILNQTTIDLQAKKIVTGTANLSKPTVFTFQLKHEGSPVAYGKTTVTEKDKEFPIDFYTSANFEEESRVTDWKKILTSGEQYTLEEIDTNGYQPKYSHRQGDSGEYSSGNTITVASGETSSYQFLVDNQKEKPKPIEVSLEAEKKLTGRELKDKDFSFELFDSNGQLIDTKENDGSSIKFKKLTFDQTGTYVYTIKEKAGNEAGMTYDGKTVTATIEITEKDDKLESKITYTDDDAKENTANQFENSFKEKPKPIDVLLEAEKKLTGRELKDQDFSFELFDSAEQLIETKENDGSSIEFKKLTFDQTGTYVYTIKEKAGNEAGMTYDGKTVTATIVITEKDDKLESTVTYTDDDAKENTANQFENTFKEKPKPIDVSLEAEKKLTGRELKDQDFSFELFDSAEQLIETKE
ncbi:Spy0128 family protein, partial [Enterococcus hulanensis]|uniref:Spy0128 family protein n=1 Tax=Enterococcus hulanensis TaxID=2559929 RepID=UPI0024B50072